MPPSTDNRPTHWWQQWRGQVQGRELAVLLAIGVAMAPLEYLCHESGHALAAILLGGHPTIHSGATSLAAGESLTAGQYFVFTLGGPLVDWLVGIAGTVLLTLRYGPLRLGLASWLARPFQYLPAWLGLELPALGLSTDTSSSDEAKLNAYLGWPPHTVLWLEAIGAALLLIWIIWRVPSAQRIPVLLVFSVGVLLGWAAWLAIGPYILPLATGNAAYALNPKGVISFWRYQILCGRWCVILPLTRRCGTSSVACWRITSRARRR